MRLASVVGLILIALLSLASCSRREPTYPVSGKVIYKDDGSPACSGVSVLFESTKEPYARAMGPIKDDGSFVLSTDRPQNGAMKGEHRVCIQPMSTDGSGMNLAAQLSKKVDPKYFELRTAGITVDIKPTGKNEIAIEVERPK
jgi:hypothetical protein